MRKPCPGPWKTPTIASNGKLTVCCADVDAKLAVADMKKQDFFQSWKNSIKLNTIRIAHILGMRYFLPVCKDCLNLNWKKITPQEIIKYLLELDEKVLKKSLESLKKKVNPVDRLRLPKTKYGLIREYLKTFPPHPLFHPDSIIQIEITDICNLKCKFCAQANPEGPHNNKKGFMEFKVFKKIIDDLVKHNIIFGTFEPFWLGESLMHPEFKKFFSYYLKHKEKISLGWQLDTNGIYLKKDLAEFIIKQNHNFPSRLNFSIDAVSENTYKKLRGSKEYNIVIKNIINLLKIRKNLDYPEIAVQFIVTKDNVKEAHSFVDFWKRIQKDYKAGMAINLKQKDGGNATENLQLFNKAKKINTESPVPYKKFRLPEKRNTLQVCGAPFKTLIIDKDGNATVCCVDNNLDLKIGNVKEKSIYNLWINNPELNQFRLNILKGIYPKKCQTCDFKNSSNVAGITEKEAKEFLISQGRYEEAKAFNESFIEKRWLRNNWWLTLEINATCNLRCPFCSQSVSWIKGNILTFKQIKELIDALIKDNLNFYSFTPFFRGESLLHPEFTKIVNYLTEISHHKLWKVITLHTNATLLTKEKTDALIKMFNSYEEGEIFFSLDAATEKTYKKLRVGGNFKQVIKNIEYFIKTKGSLPNPKMVFQFIVMDENYKEAVQFYKFWSQMLKKYNQKFVLSKFHPRLIPMGDYNTNVIFFRRKEDSPETDEHNLKLLKNVYETLKR